MERPPKRCTKVCNPDLRPYETIVRIVDIPIAPLQFSHAKGRGLMRREIQRASRDASAIGAHTITFQISNGSGRYGCCVIADAPSRELAMELFKYNWQRIERAAQECLADSRFPESEIRLLMV